MLEKREWRRIDIHLTATISVAGASHMMKADIVNVNPMGFCFFSEKGFAEGNELVLAVDMPGTGVANLRTEVVWSGFLRKEKKYSTGVRVVEKDPDELEKFLKFYNLKLLQSTGNV